MLTRRVLSLWVLALFVSFSSCSNIVKVFKEESGESEFKFNHLTVDKNTGRVYIGAVNRLYQLTADLERVVIATTGPENDSSYCSFEECIGSPVKTLTNNVNKALLIDYTTARLIACGSLFQGSCTVRSLNNVSHVVQTVREAVVANDAISSTFAFIAPGPPSPPRTHVMYVGVTYTNNSPYSSDVPAVSSRSLQNENMLKIAVGPLGYGTKMYVNSLSRDRYPIHYVYGFTSKGFSYFLTTQMSSTLPSPYVSKLVRVCQDDENYYSYTEVPIECTGAGGKKYNLAQAGYVGSPGYDLASDLGISVQDDALFALFSESEEEGSSKPGRSSALCVYSLKNIRKIFLENIKACFKGKGSRGLDFITPSAPCIETKITTIGEDFCGLDVNTPLGGEIPVTSAPVLLDNQRLTAVATMAAGDSTVAFIGTANGRLKKVIIENSTSAIESSTELINENSPVNPDLRFDSQNAHLYVMTDRQVAKVKVQDCGTYNTSSDCLDAKDPFCGWCSHEKRCSLMSDCLDFKKYTPDWISFKKEKYTAVTTVQRTTLEDDDVDALRSWS